MHMVWTGEVRVCMVSDREPSLHLTAAGIDVQSNWSLRRLLLEVEQLRDHGCCSRIIDGAAQED